MKASFFSIFLILLTTGLLVPRSVDLNQVEDTGKDDTLFRRTIKTYPKGYFVEPTDSFLWIAGTFGELRPNHFHAGIDVKTGGREGTNILAVADGYVSRIKISPYGYGKVMYITHPNGYVSVYAHLQRLCGRFADYLENEQYKRETYDLDIYLEKEDLPVRQCDTIAISGNTGGSMSPHLHFEIRDAITERACNPFLFGYSVDDTVSPSITYLKVYPVTPGSRVNGLRSAKRMGVYGSRGKYGIGSRAITVSGDIGFGIESTDYANIREAGRLGPYSVDLYVDGKRIYYHELNEVGFDESRYINSLVDYEETARSGRKVQQCFRDENNMLSIYRSIVDEGVYRFEDSLRHEIKVIVKDFFENASTLRFYVKGAGPPKKEDEPEREGWWLCTEANEYKTDQIHIELDPCALYEHVKFDYKVTSSVMSGHLAPIHSILNEKVPLHTPMQLAIKIDSIPEKYHDKVVIVKLDAKNNKRSMKGEFFKEKDGSYWVRTTVKYFGRYTVALDTVAPSIKAYNIYNGKNMRRSKTLGVKIADNLSGIQSYRGTVDGKWIGMQFEYKKALLFYEFDERVSQGRHTFNLEVKDGTGNVRTWKADFIR